MENGFLGKGFPWPLSLDNEGRMQAASGEEKIRQSIHVILMTRQGERVLRPDFGSRVWEYVFELPGEAASTLLCNEVVQAITRWEHRVDNVEAVVDISGIASGQVCIQVSWRVLATNRPDNLVFPFYLEEGQW